jgi:hypothetical protein
MKTLLFLSVFTAACIFSAKGQSFSSVTLENIQNRKIVSFCLPMETNVRYYRVEASNDSITYEIIGTIRSTGNSVLAKRYRYELHEPDYKYYRIGMVGMNAGLQYSQIIRAQKDESPMIKTQNAIGGPTIVNKHN